LKEIQADRPAAGVTAMPFVQRDEGPRDVQDLRRPIIPRAELRHFVENLAVLLTTAPGRRADQDRCIVHLIRRPREGAVVLSLADSPPPGGHAHAFGRYDVGGALYREVAGIDVHERVDREAAGGVLIPARKKSQALVDRRPDAREGKRVRDLE